MNEMYTVLKQLKNIVLEFMEEYKVAKKEKNVVDFNDIEHLALSILLKEEGEEYKTTAVAEKYRKQFIEIAVDEYQDSNLVQEYILNAISKGNNLFMVGDVKQSIYRFRQARPELFLEKYHSYSLKEEQQLGENLKVQLFKNFRSRKNILDITNLVFENIMSTELGEMEYNQTEFLNLGANYPKEKETSTLTTELHIIDLKEKEGEEEPEERIENTLIEATFTAKRIKEFIDSRYQVYDSKSGYRDITYKDIVILLRATSNMAPIYEKALLDLEIPVFSDSSNSYLETIEIQTIMSVLKIIDNPMQDIPLVTVLRSAIGEFDDNELITIRAQMQKGSYYEAMQNYVKNTETEESDGLKQKIKNFLNKLEDWREKQEYLPLEELIWKIYIDTGYYHYVSVMPNGSLRQANLKMLFEKAKQYESSSFKGLFNFIQFIDKLKTSSGDLGAAKLIGEKENVVRIMSIHKSKGLEFPVVFLCGTGKQFNLKDLNESIILHQDLGFGPNYKNEEKRVEYPTLVKEAVKQRTKIETLSEEMRILYVALTRAKEKLIITGISKDAQSALKKKKQMLEIFPNIQKESRIPSSIIKQANSYLEWLELVYLFNEKRIKDILEVSIHHKKEVLEDKEEEKIIKEEEIYQRIQNLSQGEVRKEIQEALEWEYPYILSSTIPSKTSVTKIKEMAEDNILKKEQKVEWEIPKFMMGEQKLTNAQKGTLMHFCIEKLQEKEDYTQEKINALIKELVKKEKITQEESKYIDIQSIYRFTQSKIWKEMRSARKIGKEEPFYYSIPAKEIYGKTAEGEILVQGMIDLYYINEKGNLVLVDYKTDYIKEGEEQKLIQRYKIQLEIYKRALEAALQQKVENVYIYSTALNKEIDIYPI